MTRSRRLAIALLTAGLAAPAALFFFSAIGRSLQPTAHEPARTLDGLVNWFVGLSGPWLFGLLVVLPSVAFILAGALLWRAWVTDPTLRSDLGAIGRALGLLARRPALIVAGLVVLFGAVYFAAIMVHAIAG